MKVHVLRLVEGNDLREGIEQYCKDHNIGSACVSEVQVSAIGSSLNALSGICMALLARERTGVGQYLDVNLYATALSLQVTGISSAWGCEETGDKPFGRTAHYYNIYKCKDGKYMTVGTIEPKFWQRFCDLIECPELEKRQFDFVHKEEIVEIARKIDTFDISIEPYEDCCTVFTPKHPKTRPELHKCEAEEAALDIEGLVERAFSTRYVIEIK